MDNSTHSWSTHPGLVAIGWVLAVGAAAGALSASAAADRPGTVLFGLGAVAMALAAAYGTFVRPRLTADDTGLRIRSLGGTRQLAWHEVRIRLATVRRMGRDATALEIEALSPASRSPGTPADGTDPDDDTDPDGTGLVVLGWLELGVDPRDVHDDLTALQARDPGTGESGAGEDRRAGD
ncbi:PH domain-containing protein [Prauserella aidingensis]|uniref:PH domain-containing protein n=1 Tax=Prauserella aidingensis TaxID=387890 RepID=UPI0020A309B9|nr:PH domain-containing protein [Prauserella aidingensis]MCP2254905.1 PH domain-containing protein [Prauserella aidingensis]MCP2255592.1 PH domain-containing protein [Prauserella aidingensis]